MKLDTLYALIIEHTVIGLCFDGILSFGEVRAKTESRVNRVWENAVVFWDCCVTSVDEESKSHISYIINDVVTHEWPQAKFVFFSSHRSNNQIVMTLHVNVIYNIIACVLTEHSMVSSMCSCFMTHLRVTVNYLKTTKKCDEFSYSFSTYILMFEKAQHFQFSKNSFWWYQRLKYVWQFFERDTSSIARIRHSPIIEKRTKIHLK